jgi:SWI/SNF-related matrix-associated actin-dependent regulator of chromatin subfamily A3
MLTCSTTKEVPVLARGGILADDMGLGKTLQYPPPHHLMLIYRIISLLVAKPEDSKIKSLPVPSSARATLIVSPVGLLSNWTSQISAHLTPGTLKVLVFHGHTKSSNVNLDDYDVVITSYGALTSDWKRARLDIDPGKQIQDGKSLFGRLWRRIVLDEGHTIRTRNAQVSRAASCLEAVARWSLTGTTPQPQDPRDPFSCSLPLLASC